MGAISWHGVGCPGVVVEIGHLTAHEVPDVWARSPSRPLDGDDLPDLLQREAEPLCLADEREQVERVATVYAVAGRRALGRGQNPRLLVQPQCLAAHAAAPRYLTDQEAIRAHAGWQTRPDGGRSRALGSNSS